MILKWLEMMVKPTIRNHGAMELERLSARRVLLEKFAIELTLLYTYRKCGNSGPACASLKVTLLKQNQLSDFQELEF